MREKLVARSIMVLSVACGVGSLILFVGFPRGSLHAVRMSWSEPGLLFWDGLLSLAFFLQHSGMVRREFRARIAPRIPPRYHRALYSIASGAVLAAVVVLWQPTNDHLLVLDGAFRWAARAGVAFAVGLFLWGAFTIRSLDLFGLASIRQHGSGTAEAEPAMIVRGPYRWVRHPWYLGAIVLFWSCTDLTADRLLFNLLWTVWICVGARLEERDLLDEFGAAYDHYRRQVPMLIPWRGRAALQLAASPTSPSGETRYHPVL